MQGQLRGLADRPGEQQQRDRGRGVVRVRVDPAAPKTDLVVQGAEFTMIDAMPTSMSVSPTRVVMKAFFAAFALAVDSYQKPISRYEQRPTPSQPR